MNITAFEYDDSIVIVDCGMAFPGDDMLGIDLVIPDITYLKNNYDKIKAFVITHGHEDHIGALPYVLEQINVPVYATKLTMGLIEHKLEERGMLKNTRRKVVRFGQTVNLGCFKVEFIKTNHSIQDAAALAIFSPAGIVLHTGDFKIDYTPVFGDPIDFAALRGAGEKGRAGPDGGQHQRHPSRIYHVGNGRWVGPLTPFSGSTPISGLLWRPSPPMLTGAADCKYGL